MYPEELARLYYIHSGPPDKWGLGQTQCHSSRVFSTSGNDDLL